MQTSPNNEVAGSYTGSPAPPFKQGSGSGKIIIIVIGLLALVGGGVAIALFAMGEGGAGKTNLGVAGVSKTKRDIAERAMSEQLPEWRKWAATITEPEMQQEAFAQLAWAKDKEGLDAVIAGLSAGDPHVRARAAQAIAEYGSPMADGAKPKLLEALAKADAQTKPQVLWALTRLHEPAAFDAVFAEYRAGKMNAIQKLDRSPAFDPEEIARMVELDKLAPFAGDENEGVRVLVAMSLASSGDPKWVDVLTKLVQDKAETVSREAAVGLGKIGNAQSLAPLLAAMERGGDASRMAYLTALRDGVGAKGLIAGLKSVSKEKPSTEKFQTQQIFNMLKELADPRGGDALVAYIATNPPPHFKWEAAMRLAEVGDLRAAPTLAWRMAQDPLKLYGDADKEFKQDDDERVFGARMLADLASMNPDRLEELRKVAEEGVLIWATEKPAPQSNGLRFLGAVKGPAGLAKLKAWADPSTPLPAEKDANDKGIDNAWSVAKSALRYLGMTKDPSAWGILTKQFGRRPAKLNISEDALLANGGTLLGMILKSLAEGAADGFAELGDSKAFKLLVDHIQSEKEYDQSREQACKALPWVASDENMKEVVKMVHDHNKPDAKSSFLRGCYLNALVRRPVAEATAGLVDLLDAKAVADPDVRHNVARAIGMGGLTRNVVPQMMEKVKDGTVRQDTMLAILLGGDADTAMRALVTAYSDKPELMEELKDLYNNTFVFLSDRNYDSGDVARWVANAEAIAHVKIAEKFVDWPKLILSRNLGKSFETNTGPHSITRVQLRMRLIQDARGQNEIKRNNAIAILKFMQEKGVLMAMRDEKGATGEMARAAYFELLHPKLTNEVVPSAPTPKK